MSGGGGGDPMLQIAEAINRVAAALEAFKVTIVAQESEASIRHKEELISGLYGQTPDDFRWRAVQSRIDETGELK